MTLKIWLGMLAIALTLIAFIPYIQSTLHGKTRPHVFSWVIWGLTTFVVFLAQLQSGGGAGAWPIGISGVITIGVAWLAYLKRADTTITRADKWFFIAALAALPCWYLSADPLWAVVILTVVDVLGFGPTLRKAYFFPHDENMNFFALFMVRNLVAILALEHYSLTTLLFPAVIALMCLMVIIVVRHRRRVISAIEQ
jgi:hypothetical protein